MAILFMIKLLTVHLIKKLNPQNITRIRFGKNLSRVRFGIPPTNFTMLSSGFIEFRPNPLQATPGHSNTLQVIPTHSNPFQVTPTHSNLLQSTPTNCNPLQDTQIHFRPLRPTQGHFNPLHAVLTHCRQIILTFRQIVSAKYMVLFQLAWSGSYLN